VTVSETPEGAGWVPRPDPTKLTTDAVTAATAQWLRELAATRELIETRLAAMDKATELLAATVGQVPSETDKAISALRELMEARLNAMDKATQLLADGLLKFPSDLDKATRSVMEILRGEIRSVQDVAAEKFTAIEGTFASNALALTAALAAQKEAAAEQNKSNTLAITKSEQATKETIAANAAQTSSGQASLSRELGDLKERLVRMESGGVATRAAGASQQQADTFTQTDRIAAAEREAASRAAIISVVAVLVAIAAILFAAIHG
jgi:hypothetical protein